MSWWHNFGELVGTRKDRWDWDSRHLPLFDRFSEITVTYYVIYMYLSLHIITLNNYIYIILYTCHIYNYIRIPHTMSFYVNGCQCVYNVYLVYVPCPIRDPHHTGQNHWALRSREQRRTTSLRSVSKGEWKVLELCTFCLLQIRRTYANVPAYREQRLLVLKKKRWVCPEKENIGPLILCPQNSKTYSPPYKSRPNYQSLKKSLGTNNPETRGMYDSIRVLEKRGMWLATLWWCALMRPIEWWILCWVMRFKGIIRENPEIWLITTHPSISFVFS